MQRILSLFLSSLLFVCALIGCNTTSSMAEQNQSEQHTFISDGINRTYSIYIPASIKKSQPMALLIALHGGGGSAKEWPNYTNKGFERLADREHFILVYPNGLEGQWNDGRGVERFYSHREGIDDAGFLAQLIDDLIKSFPIDADRIYVAGASNGGMMAHKFAAEYSDKVAAIATVISSMPANLEETLHPTDSVSVLMINGTEDPLVLWQGGPVKFGKETNGHVISTDRTIQFWTNHNKCTPAKKSSDLPDIAPDDGTRISRTIHTNCKSGTEVILYKIIGGGHTWPAHQEKHGPIRKALIEKIVGKRSRDIDACEVIWQFFKDHPKKHAAF